MDIQQVASSQIASQLVSAQQSAIKVDRPPVAPPVVADDSATKSSTQAPTQIAQADNKEVTFEDVARAVGQINQVIQHFNPDIEFTVDPTTKINVVKVVEKGTGQVIRQFPSDAVLGIAQALDKLQGLLVKQLV